ncbi:MAG TPA: hypothetical protein VMB52_04200 [Verrucomicrobiae bacterium]|nr:hypothetical protein [Verrucomicrobiae bacterium]
MADKKHTGEAEVLAVIASMPEPDRTIGRRLHAIIIAAAPNLTPRTWYGMPAYAIQTENRGDKIVCFFRSRQKFGERFMTIGFNDIAKLDEGNLWPISFALTALTTSEEADITALIQKAVHGV